ncbi:MAG TPA: class I SAM-dependent methyltransferase [Verrucomicrobiae bacterium]|nr:class I SAM-dependent methyltransferase [Verrucomicrobiae bacterium]
MSQKEHKNGNGNGMGALLLQPHKKPAKPASASPPEPVDIEENSVTFKTAERVALRGMPVRVQRQAIVFELYNPHAIPLLSESLADFRIILQRRQVYSGHAVVSNVVDAGTRIICESRLEALDWADLNLLPSLERDGGLPNQYNTFLKERQKFYRVRPEFKVVVTDMQAYLHDLCQWLDKLELNTKAFLDPLQKRLETKAAQMLAAPVFDTMESLIERFESIAVTLEEEDERWAHRMFIRRQLHPLLLCAPFVNHTFTKPHGYAGDFEVVNMIVRNQFEGDSLYAKLVNYWFLQQPPAQAHRNRIKYLTENLRQLAARTEGRPARVISVGCGPAHEVQNFLRDCHRADFMEFTFIDFEARALAYTETSLNAIQHKYGRDSHFRFLKKSVSQILRESGRADAQRYDLVYCAGLFDYLADPICLQLTRVLYDWVAPGGMLITTNVDVSNPRKLTMDYLLEWHLIYRNRNDFMAIKPDNIPEDACKVIADDTGVNIYFEAQKTNHG